MGRTTHEVMMRQGEGGMPGVEVFVFSRTLSASSRNDVQIINDDPRDVVSRVASRRTAPAGGGCSGKLHAGHGGAAGLRPRAAGSEVRRDGDRSNREVLERAIASWNRGDLAQYLRLYSDAVVLHGYADVKPGMANVRRFYEGWWAAFPASQLILDDAVVAGDRVACRFRITGTHGGEFRGIPPSGCPISVTGFTILRFSDGVCVERWSLVDSLGLLAQIGAPGAG
jgi:predicted ester cyclase